MLEKVEKVLQTTNYKLQTTNYKLQTTNYLFYHILLSITKNWYSFP